MNFSPVIPHLVVSDAEAAISFYEKAFGATLQGKVPAEDGKRLMHAHIKIGDGDIFLMDDFPEYDHYNGPQNPERLGGSSFTLHLEVTDADAAWEKATAAGVTVVMPLKDQFWGDRYGSVKDPFGHHWSIGAPIKESSPAS